MLFQANFSTTSLALAVPAHPCKIKRRNKNVENENLIVVKGNVRNEGMTKTTEQVVPAGGRSLEGSEYP